MRKGSIQVICGRGKGKTTSALGMGIGALLEGRTVIMIQFLKGCQELSACEILARLEPELKIFRFEKSGAFFETLTKDRQEEERGNIRNGLNFAKKVLTTGECDVLILDEALGLLEQGIIGTDEMARLLQSKVEEMDLILTGMALPEELEPFADGIRKIEHLKVDK